MAIIDIGWRSLGYKREPARIPKSGNPEEPKSGKGGIVEYRLS
jgi:hypothetical protein